MKLKEVFISFEWQIGFLIYFGDNYIGKTVSIELPFLCINLFFEINRK